MRKILPVLLAAFVGLLPVVAWAGTVVVPVYSYADFPPFLDTGGAGLSQDMCSWLSIRSKGRYEFELRPLPPGGIAGLLARPPGTVMVLWAAPQWLPHPERYRWGEPLMADATVMLAMPGVRRFDLGDARSMFGIRFGGLPGQNYPFAGLRKAVATHAASRIDSVRPAETYARLQHSALDLAFLPKSALQLLRDQQGPAMEGSQPVELPLWLEHYQRSYFTFKADSDLQKFLQDQLGSVRVLPGSMPAWRILAAP